MFLSLCYWRDIVARVYILTVVLSCRLDESAEFILPIDVIVRISHVLPVDTIDSLMALRSPEMQSRIPQIREVWSRVQQVKTGKMAVYAVLVEEVCRKFLVGIGREFHC